MTIATSNAPKESASRFWLPRIALAIIGPVLFLGLVEGALRAFHVGHATSLMDSCMVHGQPTTCYNMFFAAPFFPPGVIKTPQFFSLSPNKPQNAYRIVVLGESAAMGDPDYAYGFGRYLEVMLRERFPGTKFEVVNTGMVAINSHVSAIIARELAGYHPDLYLVYAGSNEVVGPYGPGTVLTNSSMSLPVIHASIFARSSRIGQLLTESGKSPGEWRGMEMFLNQQVLADSPRMPQAYHNFEHNLREIAKIAQDSGARALLSTIATNLRDCAPFASLHRDSLTVDSLRAWTDLVRRAEEFESSGSYSDALRLYLDAAKIDDQYAELQFRIARCFLAVNDYASAKLRYELARDLDTLRFRADSHVNEIVRTVAATSGASVQLLDTQSSFAAQSRNGIIGNELLYDHVHLTPLASYLLARSTFEQIVKTLPSAARNAGQNLDPLSEAECERLLAFTDHDRARVAGEMVERLQRPPFTGQLNHSKQVQNLLLRTTSTETPQETLAQYQWAIAQHPDDLALHYKFGFFLFDYNRQAAAQEFIRAQPCDGFPIFLPDGTRVM
jgi:tetratricopeptide (TPR) repeat protein